MEDRRQRLDNARLYLVCDDRPEEFLEAALAGGVDILQLRRKGAPDEQILSAGRRFARVCERHGALFIVNDRPDLAARAGADGVHLGQDDPSADDARRLLGRDRLVGLSTHSRQQVEAANHADIDYIGVGPVHATPTKPGRPAVGLALVRDAASRARVPFFAIGGIDGDNVEGVVAAGAERVAVVRALTEADDVFAAARRLRYAVAQETVPVGRP